jgi:hypothetical protein
MYGNMTNKKPQSHACYCAYVDDLLTKMVTSYKIASDCLQTTALRQKRIHECNTLPRQFKEGDWVLFYHKRLASQTLTSGTTGPHVIVRKIGDSTYRIQSKPDRPTIVVNVDNLMNHVTKDFVPNWILDRKVLSAENDLTNDDKQKKNIAQQQQNDIITKRIPRATQPLHVPTARPVR